MNPKKIGILAAVALVLGGIAYMTSREPAGTTPDVLGKTILENLDVNAVEKIIVTTGSATATVARAGDKWVLTSRHSYPVDFAKVREALIELSELKVGQVIKLTDARRKSLKLTPPEPGIEDTGMRVELYADDASKVATLLVGETRERKGDDSPYGYPDGRYVSTDGGETAYLVKESLSQFSVSATDWLDTEICNVTSADVQTIEITGPGRPKLVFSRKDSSMTLQGVRDEEELETSKMYSIESALSYLRLADVADPALPETVTGMDNPVVFTATTKKGEIYTARIGAKAEDSDKRYLRLSVTLKPEDPKPENTDSDEEKSDEEKKKEEEEAEKKAAERKALEETVEALSAKLAPWTFLIESYKADNLTITRDKLVKLKEKDEEKKDEDDTPKVETEPVPEVIEGTPTKVEAVKPPAPEVKPVPVPEVKAEPQPVKPPTVVTEPVAVPKAEAAAVPEPAEAPKPKVEETPAKPAAQ